MLEGVCNPVSATLVSAVLNCGSVEYTIVCGQSVLMAPPLCKNNARSPRAHDSVRINLQHTCSDLGPAAGQASTESCNPQFDRPPSPGFAIEVGGGAASESGTDEFSSTDGDDTFTSTMLKLLTATTGGGDDIIVIDIYDLLRRAHLDDLLLDSLRAGCRLDGDEFVPSDDTLAMMVASAQEAIAKACTPVSGALMGTIDKASKFHADQIKDLIASNTSGSGSQPKLEDFRVLPGD